ncbi:MAG: hypothetical protein AAFV54_04400 [Pseudomonadota bacterium]
MVDRRLLTESVVDNAVAAGRGEHWIADAAVRGFGLRLWSSQAGVSKKAYGVRITNHSGKAVRRTLSHSECLRLHIDRMDPYERWSYGHVGSLPTPTLGALIPTARLWAIDTIRQLKKTGLSRSAILQHIQHEEEKHRAWIANRVRTYTLSGLSDILINGLRRQNRSTKYCDRLDQLVHHYVPEHLQLKLVIEVEPDDIAQIFNATDMSKSAARALRPHLKKCLHVAWQYYAEPKTNPWRIDSFISEAIDKIETPRLFSDWTDKQQVDLLQWLFDRDDYWQQNLCLGLYLETDLPLSHLLSAKWDHVYVGENSKNTDGWPKELYLHIGRRWKLRTRLPPLLSSAIKYCRDRASANGLDSEFLFPSANNSFSDRPISSVTTATRLLCSKYQLGEQTPRSIRLSWHEERHVFTRLGDPWRSI